MALLDFIINLLKNILNFFIIKKEELVTEFTNNWWNEKELLIVSFFAIYTNSGYITKDNNLISAINRSEKSINRKIRKLRKYSNGSLINMNLTKREHSTMISLSSKSFNSISLMVEKNISNIYG